MAGKIFKESNNIYQDQARILFDYYRQAAEKIVSEEERIEKQIEGIKERQAQLEKDKSGLWIWFLTIILFFVYFIKKNAIEKEVAELDARIAELEKQHREIFRDYKVSKFGLAYVPVADQIKYEDKSFIVDYTNSLPEQEVKLQISRQNDLLIDTIAKLNTQSQEAPIVETSDDVENVNTDKYSTSIQNINQHDYIGGLDRSLRTIAYCMGDLDTTSVSLPLVADQSNQLDFLNEYATKEIPEGSLVLNVFDKERYAESINKFQELNKLKDSLSTKTQQFEDVLKSLMTTMASTVQTISTLKISSVDKMVLESNKILFNILKAPYNHYSPVLEYEEIERIRQEKFDYSESVQDYEPFNLRKSSRVKYNLVSGMWTAEDGSVTNSPFGVHQIYEEIVAPVVQNLMQETRIERLKIYNHIKDQKISYLNKWHQDTEAFYRANRAESADIINLMQESLREYVAAYNTLASLKKTESSMASSDSLDSTVVNVVENSTETALAFEMQSKEFQKVQNDFEEYMERLKEDIDFRAEKFGHVEYYDAKLRDGYSNEVAVAAGEVRDLEERRKALATVNPLFAKNSDLPPVPNVEDITFEHIALNLPAIAKSALEELDKADEEISAAEAAAAEAAKQEETPAEEPAEETPAEEPAEETPAEELKSETEDQVAEDEELDDEDENIDEDEDDEDEDLEEDEDDDNEEEEEEDLDEEEVEEEDEEEDLDEEEDEDEFEDEDEEDEDEEDEDDEDDDE
ncbi:MAG: hypothetical protein IIV76_04355 [Alistipes sp.]|nr:hypothetical protein [Alistipes sp.]